MPTPSMYPAAKALDTLGRMLLADDASDIGYTTYHGRKGHYYHGKVAENHPSPLHHWQLGAVMVFFGHVWGVIEAAKEAQTAMEEAEELYADDV